MSERDHSILIVDDDKSILELLSDYFESFSYHVFTAASAEEAIRIIKGKAGIDLLVTDIDMPGMSGIELLKFTREVNGDIPVVIITGLKTLDFAISAIKHGAHDYVTKPFELAEVRKVVEKVLRYRQSSQKQAQLFEFTSSMNIGFKVPTREADPSVIAKYLATFLLHSGFCQREEFHQFYVAFMETVINGIEHGNLELPSAMKGSDFETVTQFEKLRASRLRDSRYGNRLLKINFMFNKDCFSLTIIDEGPGFDWKKYLIRGRPHHPANSEAFGRGFMLIHHIIDEVYFNERGNSITLIKARKTPK